ncbi:sentrin-specific protease 2-like [Acropora millepora]|uniref:sentrin-specific protease 2-like n=1 Tax=Acropora millepora TaxID=45264 RepID=UPI001CF4E27D|nr:sentrin-specific protease 2-like [Acropora millepora]XP_044164533.1 sentrin-specific protease 2-like [Acropora millepora]
MPDIHESLMVSLFAPSTSWKSGWLNDSVINAYMTLLEKRANKNGKFVIVANSFFYERTKQQKPWRTRLDISAYKYFLFPHQNARRNHWILGVIDLEKCTISQVDPAGGKGQEFFDVVRNFLSRRSELKGRQWTVLDIAHPLQNDDVSCGVYILKIAECITEKEEIAFQQNDIEESRWQIAYRLLNNGNWGKIANGRFGE